MGKIKLFIMSFWIFFLLLIIVTIDFPVCFGKSCEFIGLENLLTIRNIIAFISVTMLGLGILFYYKFRKELKGDLDLPVEITKIENLNHEYFAFLVTIISLVAFDYTTIRGAILLIALVVILGSIFIKTELFYSNPSFALLGFLIYKADTNHKGIENSILISNEKISINDKVKYLRISNKVYFVKKA